MAKVTKRDRFTEVLGTLVMVGADAEQVGFIEDQIEMLDKRKGAERKMTQTQKDNEVFKAFIVEVLTGAEPMTATDVAKVLGEDVATQKASALLAQLVKAGEITRVEGKGKVKTVFTV